MAKTVIRFNEDELKGMIKNILKENIENGNLDEGFWDYVKGAGGAIKNKMGHAADMAGQQMKKAGQAVAGAAKNAGAAINKQVQDIKTAGEKASMNGDDQRIADQLIKWFKEGKFGNSEQAKSQISGLINAMKNKYAAKYSEDSPLQKNWD